MRLEWKPMSLSDREQIMEYISKDNPLAAIALDNQFEAIAEQACERYGDVPGRTSRWYT